MSGFRVFLPVPPGAGGFAGGLPPGCSRVDRGGVEGTLYDVPGTGRVLLLYGDTRVAGEIWQCPADSLGVLDERAGTAAGIRRRVARRVTTGGGSSSPCWLFVAGPALSRSLLPERRLPDRGP